MIKHIVLLKVKEDVPKIEVFNGFDALGAMQAIFKIKSFSYGKYDSTEGLNKGFNYGFIMDFANAEDRDYYLAHIEHVRIAETILQPLLEDGLNSVVAFDYEI